MTRKPSSDLTEPDASTDGVAPEEEIGPLRRGQRVRRRILRSTAVLPSLLTISNGLAGFGAIHFATKEAVDFDARLANLAVAAWLIFVAMVCDMLDGRVARMTRLTSDFGGQLDSLCDVISFGVAPALMMLRAIVAALRQISFVPHGIAIERAAWCVAAVYMACAALRLARFNVENEPDEAAHMSFKGLPSPGAAAAVAGLILLFERLVHKEGGGWLTSSWLSGSAGWLSGPWTMGLISIVLTVVTLALGLLMVSRVTYSHLVNQYMRGKKPFSYLVKLVFVVLAALIEPFVTLALVTVGYAASGPINAVLGRLRPRKAPTA